VPLTLRLALCWWQFCLKQTWPAAVFAVFAEVKEQP